MVRNGGQRASARYFRTSGDHHPNLSFTNYLRWAATIGWRTRSGARKIAEHVGEALPASWHDDFTGRRVLVIGSGPSLDRVDEAFFDSFDTFIHINFALRRAAGARRDYFFTTDASPIREFIDAHGARAFADLGPDRAIFAPIFTDQWFDFTQEGRAMFTWMKPDHAGWRLQRARLGPFRLPVVWRWHPRQPDWDRFVLPRPARALPVLDHTSAFTAILFAAMNGARQVGLIGCDLSAGRARSVESTQADSRHLDFGGAPAEFERIRAAMARNGVTVTNHSWEV